MSVFYAHPGVIYSRMRLIMRELKCTVLLRQEILFNLGKKLSNSLENIFLQLFTKIIYQGKLRQ